MKPNVASNRHAPSPLIPLPARCTSLACTGAGRGASATANESSPWNRKASVVSPKWLVFCCAQFGLWRGARREHPPQWGCDRRATKPQAKLGATQTAAVLFGPGFVAHSLQIQFGYARRSRLAWTERRLPRTTSHV